MMQAISSYYMSMLIICCKAFTLSKFTKYENFDTKKGIMNCYKYFKKPLVSAIPGCFGSTYYLLV